MKTEDIIDKFRRDPFNTKEQTTLVRAQGGVLMARQRECAGASIYMKNDEGAPTTGREAWIRTLSKYQGHLESDKDAHLHDPHASFATPT